MKKRSKARRCEKRLSRRCDALRNDRTGCEDGVDDARCVLAANSSLMNGKAVEDATRRKRNANGSISLGDRFRT